jgi:hypothetical protein
MFVLALAMVKNEEDVIEAFCRHTLGFADVLAVIENGSVDATPRILEALQREGLPIVVFDDPGFAHFQAEKTTALLHRAAGTFRPDAVLVLDADEFLIPGDCAARLPPCRRAVPAMSSGAPMCRRRSMRPACPSTRRDASVTTAPPSRATGSRR